MKHDKNKNKIVEEIKKKMLKVFEIKYNIKMNCRDIN